MGRRRGVSPIIAELLLIAVTVSLGTTVFFFGTTYIGQFANGFALVFGNSGKAAQELFVAENTQFTTTSQDLVPVTITNGQPGRTPAGFQESVTFNPSTYSGYEASDLGNVRFCADSGCSTYLHAWLEGCTPSCSRTATSATAWVSLPSSVAGGGGSLTIYIGFLQTSVEFDGNFWGEAPALSATYGQYDNGGSVFAGYFRGDTASGWTVAGTAGATGAAPAGSYSAFGTRAFYANSANGDYLDTNAGYSTTGNYTITYYSYTTGLGNLFFSASSTGAGTMTRLDSRGGADYVGLAKTASWNSWHCPASGITLAADTWYQFSVVIAGKGTQVGDYYTTSFGLGTTGTQINALGSGYTDGCGGTSETYSPQGSYIGLVGDGLGSSYITYWSGIVVRDYPPSGVMPTASVGSVNVVTSRTAIVTVRNVGTVEVQLSSLSLFNLTDVGVGYPTSGTYTVTSSPPINIVSLAASPYCSVSGSAIVIPVSSFCDVTVSFNFYSGAAYNLVLSTQRGNSLATREVA